MLIFLQQSISWHSEATDSSTRTYVNAYISTLEYILALWGHWQFNKNLCECLHSYIRVCLCPLRPLTVQQEPVLMLTFLHQSISWPSEATDSSTRTCINAYTPTSEYILVLWGHWQFNKNLQCILMLTLLHQSISWPSEATDSSTRTCINAYIPTSEYILALWGHWQFKKNLC